jgi:hypothetical protein
MKYKRATQSKKNKLRKDEQQERLEIFESTIASFNSFQVADIPNSILRIIETDNL